MAKNKDLKKNFKVELKQEVNDSELRRRLSEERQKLLQTRLNLKIGKEKNTQVVRLQRKKIAQILTRLKQVQILNQAKTLSGKEI
ncbi:50S ribosomal protein L29 [candidate division WWE3 bacterium CG06_land_8_20_14_3_00_42_16]|uniref:Large ribosomal subunit protein uL29 n=4 Tax=Katanobacteria TaxID=422282 RepID=A0A2M7AML4_UNCKA|nr:MAG: 50S ribosomal protein L29 [bacterium CG1_02_42_9]PIU68646.1 MAG: 50S ribosomal protein L29 [candidate division WWE3 bacterium CG06_land_8_20_14_3_00_42_16]PIZ42999.1 MAG: 50S ribosomal protein L29 [candidate division WWE3 bacterium CG_4_10_14_0_2_um_filter_42_8]PJA37989.1 MAG: 50S ribosomal protein L29 [candidate division WWE3 bacterium CG_4_9_14_3_um_filter_43_9]PJC69367.1 MAG: 50S ribosomal protein L29 [candidate division WWE3 bacterium CG_4_8_14_3_um_filter_42_11]